MECLVCGHAVVRDSALLRFLNAIEKNFPRVGKKLIAWHVAYKNTRMLRRYAKRHATIIKMAVSGGRLRPTAGIHPIGELTPEFWSSLPPDFIIPVMVRNFPCCDRDTDGDGHCDVHPEKLRRVTTSPPRRPRKK